MFDAGGCGRSDIAIIAPGLSAVPIHHAGSRRRTGKRRLGKERRRHVKDILAEDRKRGKLEDGPPAGIDAGTEA
jgi:hypothetical protein